MKITPRPSSISALAVGAVCVAAVAATADGLARQQAGQAPAAELRAQRPPADAPVHVVRAPRQREPRQGRLL